MRERTGNSAARYDSKPSPRFFLNGPLPGLSLSVSLCDFSVVTMGILFYFFFYGFSRSTGNITWNAPLDLVCFTADD